MKKRLLAGAVFAAAVIGSAFCMVGCGGGDDESGNGGDGHSHTASSAWGYDEYYHFHEASCKIVAHRTDVEEHDGDDCFCGYKTGGDTQDPPESGASEFGTKLAAGGKLLFKKISGASKYVLTVTYPDGSSQNYDIAKNKTSVDLENIEDDAFPVGKSTLRLVAYELDKIKVDGETIEQDVPMSGIDESYRVVKLNGKFTLSVLAYADEYIDLDGFIREDGNNKFGYELALKDNAATSFNITKFAKAASGGNIKFYKTKAGRDAEDSSAQYGSIELGAMKAVAGENYYYVRVEKGGEKKDYDLCVYGLLSINIKRYNLSYTTAENGVRTYTTTAIGEPISAVDRGIIAQETFFDGVDGGKLGRDANYNVIGRGDVTVSADAADRFYDLNIYFYNEQAVTADCAEIAEYKKTFRITEGDYTISLNTLFNAKGAVTVPYIIVGKPVVSAVFQSTNDVTEVVIPEGTTAFVASFQQCMGITDIYLPSTITEMSQFAFGSDVMIKSIPDSTVIHCAFSASKANDFTFKWNYIAGTMRAYETEYDSAHLGGGTTSPTTPSVSVGLNYRLDDNALTVVSITEDFNGVIPDSASYDGETYNVTAIENLCYADGSCYNGDLVIGKNVDDIAVGVFGAARTERVKSITVDPSNRSFHIRDDGMLYGSGISRVILAPNGGDICIPSHVTSIDAGAFGTEKCRVFIEKTTDTTGYDWSKMGVTPILGAYKVGGYNVYTLGGELSSEPYATFAGYNGSSESITISSQADNLPVKFIEGENIFDGHDITELDIPATLATPENVKKLFGTSINETVIKLQISGDVVGDDKIIDFIKCFPELDKISFSYGSVYSAKDDKIIYKTTQGGGYSEIVYALPNISGRVELWFCDGIAAGAFAGTAITEIDIDPGLKTIGDGAFKNCAMLTKINLEYCHNLTAIGKEAFRGCRALTSITIASTAAVTRIGAFAFYGCTQLTDVTLPNIKDTTFELAESDENGYRGVFSCCGKLKTLSVLMGYEQFETIEDRANVTHSSYITTLHCNDGSNHTIEY
ncbi:MAG: leucine-rich repeat domain-containing protein [Clostridiales bacterium]|nr:leucine-rich repeat domain-containing protein [Clostridiales bacterium]